VVSFNETYLHREGITFDYEPYAGNSILNCDGAHLGECTWYYGMKAGSTNHYIAINDRWAHTGRYSLDVHFTGNSVLSMIWSIAENMGAGKTVNGVYQSESGYRNDFRFGYEANTIAFWLNSTSDGNAGIAISNMKLVNGQKVSTSTGEIRFDVKKGVHHYVVPLGKTIDGCYVINFYGDQYVSYLVDDISFFHAGEPEYTNIDGKVLYAEEQIVVNKPVLENPSPITFSEEDMQNVVYTMQLIDETDKVMASYVFSDTLTSVTLPQLKKGFYRLEYTTQLGELVYKNTHNFEIKWFEVEYTEPNGVYEVNVEHQFDMPTTLKPEPIYKAFYRGVGQTDWVEMAYETTKAKVTFDKVGTYEIKFETTSLGNTENNTYKVVVIGGNSLASMEKDGDGVHGYDSIVNAELSNAWANDGYNSLYVNSTDKTIPKTTHCISGFLTTCKE
jgi:hypothetical protein